MKNNTACCIAISRLFAEQDGGHCDYTLPCNYSHNLIITSWWRHQMETFSALLALCEGKPPVIGGFPHKCQWRGAMMFSLINKRLNKHSRRRWLGTSSPSLWSHCNVHAEAFSSPPHSKKWLEQLSIVYHSTMGTLIWIHWIQILQMRDYIRFVHMQVPAPKIYVFRPLDHYGDILFWTGLRVPGKSWSGDRVGGTVRFLVVGTIGKVERPPRGQLWME